MVERQTQSGFTVVEMVITLVVMTLFLAVFLQLFLTGESQRIVVVRRAAANDIALTNLYKVRTKTSVSLPACTTGASSANNLIDNINATGSVVATGDSTDTVNYPTRNWLTLGLAPLATGEPTAGTSLPSSTIQKLLVVYPRGCATGAPAKIISSVTYNGLESVSHAAYVNN